MSSDKKLEDLDKRLKSLENKFGSGSTTPKPPKAPRKPSEYNSFMKDYIQEQKKKGNSTKSHKELFSDGAKLWSEKKNIN